MEELKKVLKLPMSLHMAFDMAKADGKIDFMDAGLLIGPAMALLPAIQAYPSAVAQWKGASEEQKKEVYDWAKAEYDIADDMVEAKVEAGVSLVLEVGRFVGALGA